MDPDIIEASKILREELKPLEERILDLKNNHSVKDMHANDPRKGEVFANIMLAYRHIEDARMRLGKVIQAADGGKSVYPR